MTAVRIISETGATVEGDFPMRTAQVIGVAVEGGEATLLVRFHPVALSLTEAESTPTTPSTPVLDHLRS